MGQTGVAVNTELLRLARIRKGWTLRDVTARTKELGREIDFGNLSRYERGERDPRPWVVKTLADALDVTVDELVKKRAAA